jgi:hypothetical protein
VWHRLDTLRPQLSSATCQSCRDQTAALELGETYDFLTRVCDEFEPLRAQLLARRPYVSLMDALAEIHNEETHLHDASLLQSSTILAARSLVGLSSTTRPAAPVPLASPPVVPPTAHGESVGLHCGRDGHVEAFYYKKKKAQKAQAQARCSSQGTTGSETQEILMLLHRLAACTLPGAVGSVTQPSILMGPAITSQSSTLGPHSAPSLCTNPWYLDYGTSFLMTPHSAHLSSLRPSYRHCTVHIAMVPLFLVLDRTHFVLTLFMSLMFHLFLI